MCCSVGVNIACSETVPCWCTTPPSSPDLNPIEPVWHELKRLVARRPHPPTTVEELKQAIHEAWDQLDIRNVNKYIGTMPERVSAVLAAKGRNTKF